MGNIRYRKFRKLILLTLASTLLLVSACRSEVETPYDDFVQAVETRNYLRAGDIYKIQENQAGFDNQEYIDHLKTRIEQVVQTYHKGEIAYDEALLQVDSYRFATTWSEEVSSAITSAKARLLPEDAMAESLTLAKSYQESEAYEEALIILERILNSEPNHSEARTLRNEVTKQYTEEIKIAAEQLLEEGYPRTAIRRIDASVAALGENEELSALKKKAEEQIEHRNEEIKLQVPKSELNALLEENKLQEAQKYIETLIEMGYDTTEFSAQLEERLEQEIQAILREAENLANQNNGSARALRNGIQHLNQGLRRFPNDQSLLNKRAELEQRIPKIISPTLTNTSGTVNTGVEDTDANGNQYTAGQDFPAISMKPDSSFSYQTGAYTKTRIVMNPKTADASVYANFVVEVSINGEAIYSQMPFAIQTGTLDVTFDVPEGATVEVKIRQSGFASFFEGILGRNTVFAQIYLTA